MRPFRFAAALLGSVVRWRRPSRHTAIGGWRLRVLRPDGGCASLPLVVVLVIASAFTYGRRGVEPPHRVPGLGQPRVLRRLAQPRSVRGGGGRGDRLVPLPASVPPGPRTGRAVAVARLPVRLDGPPDRGGGRHAAGRPAAAIGPCGHCSCSSPVRTSGPETSTCSWPGRGRAGLTSPIAWAGLALTKVTPGVGALWHGFRGRWPELGLALSITLVGAGLSFVAAPALWGDWLSIVLGESPGRARTNLGPGPAVPPPAAGDRAPVVGGPHRPSMAGPDRVPGSPAGDLVQRTVHAPRGAALIDHRDGAISPQIPIRN